MTYEATGGVSKRSLVLLGGLAALALNRDTRSALVTGTARAWHDANATLDGRVKPALAHAASHAQDLAAEAARRGAAGLDTLREEAPVRAHTLLESARGTAGELAQTAQGSASTLLEGAQTAGKSGSRRARRALLAARHSAGTTLEAVKPALAHAQDAGLGLIATVQDTLSEGGDALERQRRHAERTVARARRDAERELRAARREWKPQQLERAVERRVAGVQKTVARELLVLEKQARRARRDDRGGRGAGSAVTAVMLLGTGAVVLARVPVARQGILNAVGSVSPDAADALHRAGRNVRNIVGSVWMERLEEPAAPPAAVAASQVGTAAGSAPDQPTPRPAATVDGADAGKN